MRKNIQWILLFFLMLPGTGCDRNIESGLDGSVDERINNTINGYVDELKSSPYGWMASINTKEGYYRFWMSFGPGDSVIMYTDNTKYDGYKQVADTSTFAFKALQRPTLIFDTYSYLSIINDPNPGISGDAAGGYKGLNSDFEFEVDSVKNDIFYMTGRINRVGAVFKKASAADLEGVRNGLMMDLPKQVSDSLAYYYIKASYGGTEIVVKVTGTRLLYTFWYNDGKAQGEENTGYFNVEVDGSTDLFFPQPVVTPTVLLTGLKYDIHTNQYIGFYTDNGNLLTATVSYDPPDFPLSTIFGYIGGGTKVFNTLQYNDGMANSIGGTTSSSFSYMSKFIGAGIGLLLAYDLHYNLQITDGVPEFAIVFRPLSALGLDLFDGSTLTATYPAAEYRMPLTILSGDSLTFKLSDQVVMDGAAQEYYNRNVTTEMINNFKGKTFKLDWANNCRTISGLAVQFTSTETSFMPPALLTKSN